MRNFWSRIIFLVIVIIIIGAGIVYVKSKSQTSSGQDVYCTMEAKLCPDGSYVGRVPLSCEFAACPTASSTTSSIKTYTDQATGISFTYPATLSTTYISTVDWPPKLAVENKKWSCTEAGSSSAPAGKTWKQTIGGRAYCVTEETEGAAGSIYSMYAFTAPRGNNATAILTFSLRRPQCANYDEPQRSACMQEENSFNAGTVADAIFQSFTPLNP